MKYMSTAKLPSLLVGATLLLAGMAVVADDAADPVLNFYWTRARQTATLANPDREGVSYSYQGRSYRHAVDDHGRILKTDSLVARYFCTNGTLDSQRTLAGDVGRFRNLDLAVPAVFRSDYHLNLFPNDTGGEGLAIGLTSDSTAERQPDGLVIIDRQEYFLRALYLYYPHREGFRRFTRSYRFERVGDLVFPDSVSEVATRLGIFYTENYRLETGITDIQVNP